MYIDILSPTYISTKHTIHENKEEKDLHTTYTILLYKIDVDSHTHTQKLVNYIITFWAFLSLSLYILLFSTMETFSLQ